MIVNRAEVLTYLGLSSSSTNEDLGIINLIHNQAENSLKTWLRYNPERAAHVELYPVTSSIRETDTFLDSDGMKASFREAQSGLNRSLLLNHMPVVNDSSFEIREDPNAQSGQAPNAFPSSSILTKGVDYRIDIQEVTAALSFTGRIFRIGFGWMNRTGTLQVTYNAGYTADQLNGTSADGVDASALKMGALETIQNAFSRARADQSKAGTAGKVVAETIGDYEVTYDRDQMLGWVEIPFSTKLRLQRFRRMLRL